MKALIWTLLLLALVAGCANDRPSPTDLIAERDRLFQQANSRNDPAWAQERSRISGEIGRIDAKLSNP